MLMTFMLATQNTLALTCPKKENAPLCPGSGTTLLDETYPTQSFVISNYPFFSTKESRLVTQKFVNKIIDHYDYEDVPQIIISVESADEYSSFIKGARQHLEDKKISTEKIETIIKQITYLPAANYTWQQDWFESFFDSKSGSPVIRPLESYTRVEPETGKLLSNAGNSCNMQSGDNIKSDYPDEEDDIDPRYTNQSYGSGEMGGNIEGAPGGFCMVGDNQGKKFTKQFCGDENNVIQLQTSWLSVGHVDELFKIIPTNFNDGRPKECEFSLMAASPKKALELMKNSKGSKDSFIDLATQIDPSEARETRSHVALAGNYYLCEYILDILQKRPSTIEEQPAVKSVFLKLLIGSATAQDVSLTRQLNSRIDVSADLKVFTEKCSKNIDQVSNYEIYQVMAADPSFTNLNSSIDESITKDKALIKSKILSRLPQCSKYYNELDVPNLFYGTHPIKQEDGSWTLPKPGTADSFLPNPTNSVLMNKTVTFPDSGNLLFNQYLTEELARKKVKADFIATWDYAHIGKGNIHCASHSILYCRPNIQGSK